MRSITIVSLLFATWALVSRKRMIFICERVELSLLEPESPAVYATPVPSRAGSAGAKRQCEYSACRIIDDVRTFLDSWSFTPDLFPASLPTLRLNRTWKTWLMFDRCSRNVPSSEYNHLTWLLSQDTGVETLNSLMLYSSQSRMYNLVLPSPFQTLRMLSNFAFSRASVFILIYTFNGFTCLGHLAHRQ
jgi:hypothetical protein